MGRYTDFLVNEIGEDGKVVHLTSLGYGGRGKQQTGTAGGQKREAQTEKQEKKDEDEPTKQPEREKSPSPAPTPVKEFEVFRVLSNPLNV